MPENARLRVVRSGETSTWPGSLEEVEASPLPVEKVPREPSGNDRVCMLIEDKAVVGFDCSPGRSTEAATAVAVALGDGPEGAWEGRGGRGGGGGSSDCGWG